MINLNPIRDPEPALERYDGEPRTAVRPNAPRAMCRMSDRTWLLVHIRAWARLDGDRWAVLIGWSIAGRRREAWFAHDPARVKPVVPGKPFPKLSTGDGMQ